MRISAAGCRTVRVLTVAGVLAAYRTGEMAGLPGSGRCCCASIQDRRCAAVLITRSGRPALGKRPR